MRDNWGYGGKVCVVTGAASGMGKAAAEMLVDLGGKVYALDVNPADTDGLTAFLQTDLSKRESIDRAFAQIPPNIDAFFGVAGLTGRSTDYATTLTVNYSANRYIVDRFLRERMAEGGSIGFITSSAGTGWETAKCQETYLDFIRAEGWDEALDLMGQKGLDQQPGQLAYAISKRAMNYYASALAIELRPRGIRVNSVLPGSTDTGMTGDFVASLGSMERLVQFTGGGRLASPEEMAAPLVFLGSRMASYISGTALVVDYALDTEIVLGLKPDPFGFR